MRLPAGNHGSATASARPSTGALYPGSPSPAFVTPAGKHGRNGLGEAVYSAPYPGSPSPAFVRLPAGNHGRNGLGEAVYSAPTGLAEPGL